MVQKTLAELFRATRDTDFDDAFWNKFLAEVSARFAALDTIKISWDTIVQEGLGVAIDRINEVLGPAAERIQNIAALGFLSVSSSTTKTLAAGIQNFIIDAGDSRDLFVPTPFVAVTREADPHSFAIGQVSFFDRTSGSMDITIVYLEGDAGPHNDWTISAVAGQALAQATILNETVANAAAALASKNAAATSATNAASSATAAGTAKGLAEGYRDELNTRIAPPGATPPTMTALGRLWFDTQLLRVWDGSSWAPAVSSTLGGLRFESGVFGASPTGVITVSGGFTTAMVFLNGSLAKITDDYTVATPTVTVLAPVAGMEYFVWGYKALDATDYYTKEEVAAIVAEKGAHTGDVKFTRRTTVPQGWMKANGAAVSRSAYPELDAAIYVGDANNGTALDGYRCTSTSTPSTTRSTSGAYIVLPDLRGEFIRGLDDGRGVDSGRVIGSSQASQNLSHDHVATIASAGDHNHAQTGSGSPGSVGGAQYNANLAAPETQGNTRNAGAHIHTATIAASGGSEARPRNIALMGLIKY